MHACISSHELLRSWPPCARRVNAGNKNTPSMHHPRRQNVTTSMAGLKTVTCAKNLTQNGEPQRYSWKCRRKKKRTGKRNLELNSWDPRTDGDPMRLSMDVVSVIYVSQAVCVCVWVSVSAQDGIVVLGKAHTRSAPSLSSLPKVTLETVPIFVWLNTDRSRPWRVECWSHPFSTPLSFGWSVLWCSGLSMFRKFRKPLSTSALPNCRPDVISAVLASLSFPQTLACPGQWTQWTTCKRWSLEWAAPTGTQPCTVFGYKDFCMCMYTLCIFYRYTFALR